MRAYFKSRIKAWQQLALRFIALTFAMTMLLTLFALRNQLVIPITGYYEEVDPSAWVMVEGQTTLFNVRPVPRPLLEQVSDVDAERLSLAGYQDFGLEDTGRRKNVFVHGIEPDSKLEPVLLRGAPARSDNHIVLDVELHEYLGLDVGDSVTMSGGPFIVSGISDSYGSTTYIPVFVTQAGMTRLSGLDEVFALVSWSEVDESQLPSGLHVTSQEQFLQDMRMFVAESSDPLFGLTIALQIASVVFTMVAVMLIEVRFNIRALALLRSIGATRGQIHRGEIMIDLTVILVGLFVALWASSGLLIILDMPFATRGMGYVGPQAFVEPQHVAYTLGLSLVTIVPALLVRLIKLRHSPVKLLNGSQGG